MSSASVYRAARRQRPAFGNQYIFRIHGVARLGAGTSVGVVAWWIRIMDALDPYDPLLHAQSTCTGRGLAWAWRFT
jgi:hypothetical protein